MDGLICGGACDDIRSLKSTLTSYLQRCARGSLDNARRGSSKGMERLFVEANGGKGNEGELLRKERGG